MLIDHIRRVVENVHGGRDISRGKRWLVVNQSAVVIFVMRSDILGLDLVVHGDAVSVETEPEGTFHYKGSVAVVCGTRAGISVFVAGFPLKYTRRPTIPVMLATVTSEAAISSSHHISIKLVGARPVAPGVGSPSEADAWE